MRIKFALFCALVLLSSSAIAQDETQAEDGEVDVQEETPEAQEGDPVAAEPDSETVDEVDAAGEFLLPNRNCVMQIKTEVLVITESKLNSLKV